MIAAYVFSGYLSTDFLFQVCIDLLLDFTNRYCLGQMNFIDHRSQQARVPTYQFDAAARPRNLFSIIGYGLGNDTDRYHT